MPKRYLFVFRVSLIIIKKNNRIPQKTSMLPKIQRVFAFCKRSQQQASKKTKDHANTTQKHTLPSPVHFSEKNTKSSEDHKLTFRSHFFRSPKHTERNRRRLYRQPPTTNKLHNHGQAKASKGRRNQAFQVSGLGVRHVDSLSSKNASLLDILRNGGGHSCFVVASGANLARDADVDALLSFSF
jgi:hypothetical protein